MLGKELGKNLNTFENDYVVFDLETTGMNPYDGDRIVEVSALRVVNHKVIDEFSTLINPEQHITEDVVAVH